MAEKQKNTIYNVRVTAEDALKTLAELKLRSQELRDQQKALGKVTEENAQEYYALDNQIKAINSEANKYQKQIQNNIKLQNQQEASLAKLRTQLALDNAEFAELGNSMQDAARKAELGKRIAETTKEVKAQEEALGTIAGQLVTTRRQRITSSRNSPTLPRHSSRWLSPGIRVLRRSRR